MTPVPAADFLILDAAGAPVATVEAKVAPPRWSRGWDEEEARLLAAAAEDGGRFAVLISPRRLKVWDAGEPAADADAGPLLGPSFEATNTDPADVSGIAFEMICEQLMHIFTDRRPASWGDRYAAPAAYLRDVAPELADAVAGGELVAAAAGRLAA